MVNKKKKFVTKREIRWKTIDIVVIVTIIFVNLIISLLINYDVILDMFNYNNNFLVNLFTIFFMFISIFSSSIPFIALYFGFRYAIKKVTKENATFDVIYDIEYYREKFNDINPATMSLLMDLELEPIKDLGAMKLYYELKKVLLYNDQGLPYINTSSNFIFNKSDEILLNYFINNNYDNNVLNEWKENVIYESFDKGLIKWTNNNNKKKSGRRVFLFINLLIFFFIVCFSLNFDKYDGFYEALETIPGDNLSVLKLITSNSDYMIFTIEILLAYIIFIINSWNFISAIIYMFTKNKIANKHVIKRTNDGNILTEKLYGMKNFINDFSNLDDASRKHLALWDEFLIYAVVLEENDIILSEISNMYHIDLLKYKNYN